MNDRERAALLALLLTPGSGRVAAHRAMAAARHTGLSLDELIHLPPRQLSLRLPVGHAVTAFHLARCSDARFRQALRLIAQVAAAGGRVACPGDAEYPAELATFLGDAAPPIVFTRGDLELLAAPVAGVVGTRSPSPQGREVAISCAGAFAGRGVSIVSGGAAGVDSAAHTGALAAGGTTIIVLPQGLLTYSPPRHVAEAVASGRALLLSEFNPAAPWETYAAVTRNATIATLAQLLCVIEPRREGGCMHTARHAASQGKRLLYYGVPQAEAPGSLPVSGAGSFDLLSPDGLFQAERLLRLWESRPPARVRQPRLL